MKNFDKKQRTFLFISAWMFILMVAACNISRTNQKSEQTGIDKAFLQDFERTKDISTGTVPRERLLIAIQRENELFNSQIANRAVPGIAWQERGPNNVGGRIRAVLVDKNDLTNKKVWIGGVGGGIWYTNDITATNPVWNKVNDFLDNMAITDIIQDPSTPNTMYASTGEGWFNSDSQQGLGIFKSTDGGNTWTALGSTANFQFVQDLEFDKNGKLYAAVRGSGTTTCIMRSSDAGTTWNQVLTTPTASSSWGGDLELSKDGDLYASVGVLFANGGIYKSPAGANVGNAGTWTNITPNPTTGAIEVPNNQYQRIKLAASPSDNNVLYAVMQGGSASAPQFQFNCRSIQQYNAGTNTWTVRTVPKIIDQQSNPANYPIFTRGQAFYDLTAAVDPNDPATLYVSGIDACKSTDNGATWNQISVWTNNSNEQAAGFTDDQVVHADHHNFVFVGGSSSAAILANDGGIYYTTNVNTGTNRPIYVTKNLGLNITQLYAAAIHPTAGTEYYLDGCQDNGSHKYTNAGLNNVTQVTGGDGGFCHISPLNPNHQITSYTNNNYYISTNGGVSFPAATAVNNPRGSFINPTDYDGVNLYGGDNAGTFFRWLDPQSNGATGSQITVANFSGATVTHVSISKLTANRVYFGLNDGAVIRVDNAHSSNTGIYTGTPTSGSVSCIASRETNEDSMLVSYSNYNISGNKIYVTANGTADPATFTNITGNLPDMPVRWVMFDPRSHKMVIAATELGVWSCDDITVATPQWTITSSGLARVRVDMLKYRSSDRTLLAATHGRGLFSAKIPANLNPEVNFNIGSLTTSEQKSLTTNTCVNYTDYAAAITINGAPSGADATVTIAVAGGTATDGKDYDILVNGTIGKIITIPANTTDSKPFTIRVYDDAIVEGSETINLNFTTTGGGSSIGTTNATLAINIIDNDAAIAAPTTAVTTAVGASTGDVNTPYSPFWGNGGTTDVKYQTSFNASELSAAGLVAGSNITEMTINLATKNSTVPFNNFNIKLGHTTSSATTGSGFLPTTNIVTCYSNTAYNTTLGDNVFIFSTAFVWDGSSNVTVQYCYDNTTTFTSFDHIRSKSAALGAGVRAVLIIDNTIFPAVTDGCALPTGTFYSNDSRPITKFKHYKPGTGIETVAGNTKVEFVPTATAEYDFFSPNNKVLAKIKNPSQDLACVTANLVNDGNGVTTPFFSGMRSSKIWSITPATNGSTVAYTISLYMTTAELAGANPSTFKIYKSSAATIGGATAGNTVTAATTVSQNAEFTSFTASFTGFSLFFIGTNNIVLPLYYNDFTGVRSGNSNILNWKSSVGSLLKFEVERSLDAVNFSNIGTVNYSTSASDYRFTDNLMYTGRAYYRLKMYLPNGSYSYSYIISLDVDKNDRISVYPSPARSEVVVSISDKALLNTFISIIDNKGAVLKTIFLTNLQQRVPLGGMPAGIYHFRFADKTVVSIIKE